MNGEFASSHDTEDLIDKLNFDLVNIMDWLTVNKLQSHAKKPKKKTKFI